MDSKRLSERLKQPGHDRTFEASERKFVDALELILDGLDYRVIAKPNDLRRVLGGDYGIAPEASIEYRPLGRKMYFEVKKQGPRGNAEERACKHHTVAFYKTLKHYTGWNYHPYATIMCESLATDYRYTKKHPFFFEADHYFNWVEYDLDALAGYINRLRAKYLEVESVSEQLIPK